MGQNKTMYILRSALLKVALLGTDSMLYRPVLDGRVRSSTDDEQHVQYNSGTIIVTALLCEAVMSTSFFPGLTSY